MSTTRTVARNTLYLSIAQGIRIVLAFALILYIANAYGAVWQGKFSILLAFLNIFIVLASFGMPRLITREVARDYAASNRYFWAGMLAQGVTTILMMVVMVVIVAIMPYPLDTKQMLWLSVLALPLFTLYSVAGALLRAFERMQYLVYAELLSSILQLALAFVLLAGQATVLALAVIRISGIALAAVATVVAAMRLGYVGRPRFVPGFARRLLVESLDFFGMATFDALLQRLDILILSILAGEAATGIYDAAFQLVKVLMTLVLSFTDAIYPALSRLYTGASERFSLVLSKAMEYGLILLLPVAVGIMVLAQDIIAFLYRRPDYAGSAVILQILGWTLIAYFGQILLTRGLMAGDRPRPAFQITALMALGGAVLMSILTLRLGPSGTAWGLLLVYVFGFAAAWRSSHSFHLSFGFSCLVRPALAAAMMGATLYFLPAWPVPISVGIGVITYGLLALGLRVFDQGDMQVLRALLGRQAP